MPAHHLVVMTNKFIIRPTTVADAHAVDALLARSYPVLLAPDYAPDVLAAALPGMTRAKPELLTCGTYFVAVNGPGQIIAAGGWTKFAPTDGSVALGIGHVRHVATDPDNLRMGVARALMGVVMRDAEQAGVHRMDCLSTLTAVPFYAALGFVICGALDVVLRSGAVFPAIAMRADVMA